jgi:rod shape determining protein RodA
VRGELGLKEQNLSLRQRLWSLNWGLLLLIFAVAGIGILVLYSVARGEFEGLVARQLVRFGIALGPMIVVAVTDIRVWLRYAYTLYAATLAFLLAVEVIGSVGMGAQRWVDVGIVRLQPSEFMKITLVLALARYFHARKREEVGRLRWLLPPAAMVAVPVALVIRQPDLGTAILLLLGGGAMFFLAGVAVWQFGLVLAGTLIAIPFGWQLLRGYQQQRVLTFLDPERDPLGAGYQILQSKIALGSGGLFGRGYMEGTQGRLDFLPEKQTDFVFTMLAEEFGLAGSFLLMGLYAAILAYGFVVGLGSRNQFGRLLCMGVSNTFFLYVFVNIAMVTGLIPVVGVPLPLISYGGTAIVTLMVGFGLIMCVSIHRDVQISRQPEARGGAHPRRR